MSEHVEIIIRSFLAFSILLIGARFLGKQTISQMNVLDFIIAISIGAITANLSFNLSVKIHHSILAFSIFVAVSILTSYISLKSYRARRWITGNPTVVIENGQILEKNMRKARYNLNELNQLLRERNVFNIEEVLYAIVETNGKINVLKKPEYQDVTKQDVQAPLKKNRLPVELIMDGKVLDKNLKENKIQEEWLSNELEKRNLKHKDVFYAVISATNKLFINTYENQLRHPKDLE
ncbi:DUF421 domain-containing protein [Shouchella hunanensis]|uniref:DUF421 domain-containing protein n=1 Tax=Shouchella hunanensis TaxID=766894 RepID=A0ABY7WD41_9BACI|nr:DUF421 domain-containing protein [Shouchella hunanensis]WDF05563.1 DUF421 domain-containing protein [Shouchella hunanensis]GAF21653.1 hypothetical protein JCM19047_1348 [Bacillus sp. JCM 19047]